MYLIIDYSHFCGDLGGFAPYHRSGWGQWCAFLATWRLRLRSSPPDRATPLCVIFRFTRAWAIHSRVTLGGSFRKISRVGENLFELMCSECQAASLVGIRQTRPPDTDKHDTARRE